MQLHMPSSKNLGKGNCQRPQGDFVQKQRMSMIPRLCWRMCPPPAWCLVFSIYLLIVYLGGK